MARSSRDRVHPALKMWQAGQVGSLPLVYLTRRITTGNRLTVKAAPWCSKNRHMHGAVECYSSQLMSFITAFMRPK